MHPVTDKKLPVQLTVDSKCENFIPQESTVKPTTVQHQVCDHDFKFVQDNPSIIFCHICNHKFPVHQSKLAEIMNKNIKKDIFEEREKFFTQV